MSFTQMKKPELVKMATEDFAIEVPEKATIPQILALLTESGVTWAMAVEHSDIAKSYAKEPETVTVAADETPAVTPLEREPEPQRPGATITTDRIKNQPVVPVVEEKPTVTAPKAVLPDKVLLRMDRENGTYQVRGYKFTRQHPYALVAAKDAEFIVENIEGFYYATPKEAQEFYG